MPSTRCRRATPARRDVPCRPSTTTPGASIVPRSAAARSAGRPCSTTSPGGCGDARRRRAERRRDVPGERVGLRQRRPPGGGTFPARARLAAEVHRHDDRHSVQAAGRRTRRRMVGPHPGLGPRALDAADPDRHATRSSRTATRMRYRPRYGGFVSHRARGGEVWVVDPRRTETARVADRHLAPRPGSDWLVLAHLVRALLPEAGTSEDEALRARATGVDELRVALEPLSPDVTSAGTGIALDDLDDLVEAVRRHGRVSALTGTGVSMSATANVAEWLLWALHVVTDSYDQPGGMWFNPGYLLQLDTRTLAGVGRYARSRPAEPARAAAPLRRVAVRRAAQRDRGRKRTDPLRRRRQPGDGLSRRGPNPGGLGRRWKRWRSSTFCRPRPPNWRRTSSRRSALSSGPICRCCSMGISLRWRRNSLRRWWRRSPNAGRSGACSVPSASASASTCSVAG